MSWWDIFILAVGLVLVIEGLLKGAIRLAFGLAGLVAAALYAGYLADRVSTHLGFLVESLRRPVALVVGFLLILAVFVLVGALASKLIKAAGLGLLNRLLGAILGFLVTIYLAGCMVAVGTLLSPERATGMTRGPVMRFMVTLAIGVEELIPAHPSLPGIVHPKKTEPAPPPKNAPAAPAAKPKADST